MSTNCKRCNTQFDSPFCPNCGAPAQIQSQLNRPRQLDSLPPPNIPFLQNQYINNTRNQKLINQNLTNQAPLKKSDCLIMGTLIFGGIVLTIIILIVIGAIIDNVNKSVQLTTNSDSIVNSEEIPYLTDEEIQYLYSDVEKYIGKRVKISGIVFRDPEKDEDGVYFQMFQNANSMDNNTVVAYSGNISIKDGDFVIIDGIIKDEFKGKNAFGGTINAPAIVADIIVISTYKDVICPAEKIIEVKETKEQYGYEITIDKIEFSKIETRVYITVNNNGDFNFSTYSFNMKLLQDKQQYVEQRNWKSDYPEIQTDLLPGSTTNGVICFPIINETKDFALYIDGGSDNWNEEIKEYIFEVNIE